MIFLLAAFVAHTSASLCSLLSCAQCTETGFGVEACEWCETSNSTGAGSCTDAFSNCSTGVPLSYATPTSCGASYTFNKCETINDCATCAGTSGCSFCVDATSGNGLCVSGANACTAASNTTALTAATCTNYTVAMTTICEKLSCQQCFSYNCQWCGTAAAGTCVSPSGGYYSNCPLNLGPTNLTDATCPGATLSQCEKHTACTDCIADTSCSFCSSDAYYELYGFCVTGVGACIHNDSVTSTAGCNVFASESTSICESLDCQQCLGSVGYVNSCNLCQDPKTGATKCSTLPCPPATPSNFSHSACASATPSQCAQHADCASCFADTTCNACGVSEGYFACVTGPNACPNLNVTSVAVCNTITQSLTSVCEALSCDECFADQGQFCSWCGSSCVTGFECPGGAQRIRNVSVCATAPANPCESLSCDNCVANNACSYCAVYGQYGFCVNGTDACTHNDTVAAAQCSNITQSLSSVCNVLSCNQCINQVTSDLISCSWCGSGSSGSCTNGFDCQPVAGGSNQPALNSSICPAPNACENLGCSACLAASGCSYCSQDDGFGNYYGVCVEGSGVCSHGDAVTSCSNVILNPCPLLSCSQCINSELCSWCGTGSAGSCTSGQCNGNAAFLSNVTQCGAPTACEQHDCTSCLAASGCSYCYDPRQSVAACVTGTNVCGNATIASAKSCPAPAPGAPTPVPTKKPVPGAPTSSGGSPTPSGSSRTGSPTPAATTPTTGGSAAGGDAAASGVSIVLAIVALAAAF